LHAWCAIQFVLIILDSITSVIESFFQLTIVKVA
jgi:hypothetical protein